MLAGDDSARVDAVATGTIGIDTVRPELSAAPHDLVSSISVALCC
jgi:hypothetical protein